MARVVRFLHTADWQLGMTRVFLGPEAQARYADARLAAISRLGELARERECAFVLVCGDVFESSQVERKTVTRALDVLAGVPVPVYLLPGNHDPLDAASVYRSPTFCAGCPAHVQVIEASQPIPVAAGVELVGAPWRSKRPVEDLAAAAVQSLTPAPEGTVRILAAHGAVAGLGPPRDDPAAIHLEALEAGLREARVHYVALGDRHSTTSIGKSGAVCYAGTPEPTDFDESDPGNVLVVDVGPGGARVTPCEVGTWRFWRERRVDLTGPGDLEALEARLLATPAKERTVARLGLVGALALREKARLDAIIDGARDLFAALECDLSQLAVLPDDADFADLGLDGFAARAVERLRAAAAAGSGAPSSGDPEPGGADAARASGRRTSAEATPAGAGTREDPKRVNGMDGDRPPTPLPTPETARDALALLVRLAQETA